MAYKGLDEYLIRLEQARGLTPVSRRFESLEAALAHTSGARRATLFTSVDRSPYPIVTGLFATERQMAWALGLDDLEALNQRLDRLLDPSIPTQFSDLMARAGDLLGAVRLGTVNGRTSGAKAYESIRDPGETVRSLPQDARDTPGSLPGGMAFYRIGDETRVEWVHGRVVDVDRVTLEGLETAGCAAAPAALVWGSDPALMWASGLRLPQQISPLWLAGWLRGKPVPMTSALTQAIEIPADAELVLEGALTGRELCVTGGLQRAGAVLPVIERTAASDRARDMVIRAVLRLMWPQVAAVRTINHLLVVALKAASPPASQQVIYGVWALRMTAHLPLVLVIDADVDIQDERQIARAVVRALAHPDDWLAIIGSPQRLALDGRVTANERRVTSAIFDGEQPAEVLRVLSGLGTLDGRLTIGADGRANLDLRVATSDL